MAETDIPEPSVEPVRYRVSCLPDGHELAHHMSINVEYRGRGLWAVMDGSFALDVDGNEDYEMRPSERDDDWLKRYRHDLDTALEIAKKAAPQLTVNGWTVEKVLARDAERKAADGR